MDQNGRWRSHACCTCNGVSNDDDVVGDVSLAPLDSPVFGNCHDMDFAKLLRHELSSGSGPSPPALLPGLNARNCLLPSTQLSRSANIEKHDRVSGFVFVFIRP